MGGRASEDREAVWLALALLLRGEMARAARLTRAMTRSAGPAEFLWQYIHATPMVALVADERAYWFEPRITQHRPLVSSLPRCAPLKTFDPRTVRALACQRRQSRVTRAPCAYRDASDAR
jgi:hypothetical protein